MLEWIVEPGDVALIVNGELVTSTSQAVFAALWGDVDGSAERPYPDMVCYTSLDGEM